ncbi:MAG: ATP-binding protein [Acidobacteriota bacterium]|nr:ATP-binding protein [Acidobacteriota bacterium]
MSFRIRLLMTVATVALLSLAVLALGLRREVAMRLTDDYGQRVEATVLAIERDLELEGQAISERLTALSESLQNDNRFRLAATTGASSERQYLLDYAAGAMRLAGLSTLQIHDEDGRIVTSGHFRNEHGRRAPALTTRLVDAPPPVVFIDVRTPERSFLALSRGKPLSIGGRGFTLVGGVALDERFLGRLTRNREVAVTLAYSGLDPASDSIGSGQVTSPGEGFSDNVVAGRLVVPVVGPDGVRPADAEAYLLVTHSQGALDLLLGRVDSWFVGTALATALVALGLAVWLSSRVSRPLADLAEKTAILDLDRLDIEFDSGAGDEVGRLSRLLGDLTDRLRTSSRRLQEAEHRAAVGQMARQVTHDIKNGLIPLRNVFQHLSQVQTSDPTALVTVFGERRGTIDAGIDYLETLATNYARLSPTPDRRRCDLNAIVEDVIESPRERDVVINGDLAESLPPLVGDPVSVRRILENLVANAVDSLQDARGTVDVVTQSCVDGQNLVVRVAVTDTGQGMTEAETAHIFTDFYTTKPHGTGLGLSIVRRLVLDLEGTVRVTSQIGVGTTVTIEIPVGSVTERTHVV